MTRAIYIQEIKTAECQAKLRAKMEARHADLLGSVMEVRLVPESVARKVSGDVVELRRN